MEMKAYLEGIGRKWWLIGLVLVLSIWIGNDVANHQTYEYTATTSIQLNSPTLVSLLDPTNVMKLSLPLTFEPEVAVQANIDIILKHYPRLTRSQLLKKIVVATDKSRDLLLISVTDISPNSAADIANYLAEQFVRTQNADLARQLDYYENWLQQTIPALTNEINKLNLEIQQLTPPPARIKAPLDPKTQQTISTDQYHLDLDERNLYNYEQALASLQSKRPLFAKAYVILQPATGSAVPVSTAGSGSITLPTSTTFYELLAAALGLLTVIILIIAIEYFTPFVRHQGELQRIAGLSVLAESPNLNKFDLNRLMQSRPPLFLRWQMNALRLACAAIGAPAIKGNGYTVVLTSPRKKRNFASVLATFLARNGQQTLLIDADYEHPRMHEQVKFIGSLDAVTNDGGTLSFIKKTTNPHLFVLPATATLAQNVPLTSTTLMDLLPGLQNRFSMIIIDAPPLDRADTHLLAKKATQTLLLVKKRRDSLKSLKMTHTLSQDLNLNMHSLLLT